MLLFFLQLARLDSFRQGLRELGYVDHADVLTGADKIIK